MPQSINETIKRESNYLRGNIAQDLENKLTQKVSRNSQELMKFHGIYMQDDRDIREEREHHKLEPAYSYMIRVPLPGGVVTTRQWLALDQIARTISNNSIRLTSRQAVQFHKVPRSRLKDLMQLLDQVGLCSLNGCGDITRNIMNTSHNNLTLAHQEAHAYVNQLAKDLRARTNAWREIWLNEENQSVTGNDNQEPLYGPTYMPRKFKMTLVIPPDNDTDVYSQDIGLIAIIEKDSLIGFNVSVGGGLGMTFGDDTTYPQLGQIIHFCPKERLLPLCEAIIGIQRDFGDRENRRHARMKYTITNRGLEWFKDELAKRLGEALPPPKPFAFTSTGDLYGWQRTHEGLWNFCMLIENGRVIDRNERLLLTGLREIATIHKNNFALTGNQNLIISGIQESDTEEMEELIRRFHLDSLNQNTLRRHTMACVAFPTCQLAMSESERYFPHFLDKVEQLMDELNLHQREIKIRMSGCPNSCSRPTLAEIGLIGRAPGKYNLYIGGSWIGDRLNKLYRENIDEARILSELRTLFLAYKNDALAGEYFGDFALRSGFVAP